MSINLLTATAADLQNRLVNKTLTSKQLVRLSLNQIARHNDYLKAVIATAPEALLLQRATELDNERVNGNARGPFHGIPVLVKVYSQRLTESFRKRGPSLIDAKDNIATCPRLGLPTTCGSLALEGSKPHKNAVVVDRVCHFVYSNEPSTDAYKLIAAGAIILGKANLSVSSVRCY